MKTHVVPFLVVAVFPWFAVLAEDNPNLVQNPGFETVAADRPAGWGLAGKTDLDNAQFYAGRMGLQMRHDAAATSSATQTVRCGAREHLAGFWVRTEKVAGTGARLRLLGPAGQVVAESKPVTGDAAWQLVTFPCNPGDTRQLTLELSLADATGAAWFDDVVLGETDKVKALLTPQGQVAAALRENLALGKKYELSPPPNYEYCTDPGDTEQLTDGQYTVGYFWTQKSTVGWYLFSPQITIDLGRVEPIDGIMINCPGGGTAGVQFPLKITYLVSDDNETFHEVAELTPRGLKQDGKAWYTHRFLADGLKTRGRYVMLRLEKAGTTAFTDEIEVYKGNFDPAAITFTGAGRNRLQMAYGQYSLSPETYTRGHSPETPHVKWATPLAAGPIKSILMAFSDDMRDVVEIAQRLDLDYVPVQHFSFYGPETLGMLMQEQITTRLPNCEVMVVGGFRWEAMPKPVLEQIKARVQAGMGLVCVTPVPDWLKPIQDMFQQSPIEGDADILKSVPMVRVPQYRQPKKGHFHLAQFGQGRIAWLNWAEFTRGGHSLLPSFQLADIDDDANATTEYAQVALGKLICWAAHRDTTVLTALSATPQKLTVSVAPLKADATLDIVLRDRFFDPVATQRFAVPAAGVTLDWTPPPGMNGVHPVDVTVRDADGKVLDFGAAFFEADNGCRIETVTLDKPFYAPGEILRATVKTGGTVEGVRLEARLCDTHGREVCVPRNLPLTAAGDVALELGPVTPLTLGGNLYLSLVRGSNVIEKRFDRVWFDLPEKDDYTFCAWYAWDAQPIAYYGMRLIRKLGVDAYVSLPGKWRAENAAYGNVRHGPENVERVCPQNKDDSLVRVPCLTNPAYRAKVAERVEKLAAELRPYGVTEWSFGDESTLGGRDYCTSPTCLAAFREYLKAAYGTIAALNQGWDAEFATWDDVVPMTRAEIEKRDNIAPWLDHRRYMEKLFADYHAWLGTLVVKHIPAARVGISGTPNLNSYSGHDWWLLMQTALTHLSGYGGIQCDLQRSFRRPGTFVSTFLGYDYKDNDEQRARFAPWDLVFNGSNGVNYYTLESDTLNCPLIRPDMSLTHKAPWFFEEVRQLKDGFGLLFMHAAYANDGIAIHYSPASVHAATATGLFDHRDRLRNYSINLSNLGKILQQCHLQVDFVCEEQMARGELARYRLLILPWAAAVSDREATAIREFVRNGGTVLADSLCGVRNAHGKPQAMLDDLFGIRQAPATPALEAAKMALSADVATAAPALAGVLQGVTEVPVASGSAQLQLAGGHALAKVGDVPALVINRLGKGQAFFLNSSFSNYAEVWSGGVAGEVLEESESPQAVTAPIRALVQAIVAQAGIQPPVRVTAAKGMDAEVELSRLDFEDAQLLGVVRSIQSGPVDRGDVFPCELTLPEPAHVYEARSGTYLGKTQTISEKLPRGIARVYVALPYRVDSVKLDVPGAAAPGTAVAVHGSVAGKGWASEQTHVLHLAVTGPDGKDRPWYAQNLAAPKGRFTSQIPLAWNDPAGRWTLTATDIMTGTKASARFELTQGR